MNESHPIVAWLNDLMRCDNAKIVGAVTDTCSAICNAWLGRHGPKTPNTLLGRLHGLAKEEDITCASRTDPYLLTEVDIPKVSRNSFLQRIAAPHISKYKNWLSEHGGKPPEWLEGLTFEI
jgi:hypothetical protein